tara:strand:+ start:381 stop:530 length:150 start_codon:yes stop_codon:yes gene_type:complete
MVVFAVLSLIPALLLRNKIVRRQAEISSASKRALLQEVWRESDRQSLGF